MLEGLTPPTKKVQCSITKWRNELSEEDQRIFDEALENPQWSTNALASALQERGAPWAYYTLSRHRQGICVCNRGNNARESLSS